MCNIVNLSYERLTVVVIPVIVSIPMGGSIFDVLLLFSSFSLGIYSIGDFLGV